MLPPPPPTTTTVAVSSTPMEATEEILSYDLTEDTFTAHDVVLGKGNGINCLPGNVKFRQIIAKYKPLYNSTPRSLKGGVAELVINEVACMDPPGRFLEATADKRFKQVPRKRAIEKTCQALREKKTGSKLESASTTAATAGKCSPTNLTDVTSSAANPTTMSSAVVNRRRYPPPPPSSSPVATVASVPAAVVVAAPFQQHQQHHHQAPPPLLSASTTSNPRQNLPTTGGPLRGGALEVTSSTPPMHDVNSSTNSEVATDQEETQQQQPVWPIRENDVLYGGRGRKHFHRAANQRFLELVKYRRNDYHESTSKKNVALCILEEWKQQTPPGRFLQQDAKTEAWFEISTAKIQEKTCQALRDLKRERGVLGPGGVRPATIADRMVDPNDRNHQVGGISSGNCSNSSGDESNNSKSSNSLQDHVQQDSHVHQQPPLQHQPQHNQLSVHHGHQQQLQQLQPQPPQHQHSAQLSYQPQQQYQQHQFAPHPPQGPLQHYPKRAQQPIYSHPPAPRPPQQQQQQHQHQRHHHHALPPMHDQQVSPLSPHDHVYPSHPHLPVQGAPLPPSPQGPTSPPHQHHLQFSPAHTPPGQQNGWFQDRNSPIYTPHTVAYNSSNGMMRESYAPPIGRIHQQQHPHHSQYLHTMAPAPSAPSTYHLAARPSPPPPPPPAFYQRNTSYSQGADTTRVPPPPPLPTNMEQDPHTAAIQRQAHIVAQEMRKMDEMMRQVGGPGCGQLPPPPPARQHSQDSQPVPRTVVATTNAPLSPPLPPSIHHGQVPIWHGHDQVEMVRHAPVGGRTMPETRYGEVAVVPTTPHCHYSPHTSAASHGDSSGSYQQQLSPVTNSIISTSSTADGSSSISIGSCSGDLSHGHPPGPLSPTKEEETTVQVRQVPMNATTTFAPIQNEDDGNSSNRAYRAVDGAAHVQPSNALARVVVQNVPLSPPRRQRNELHHKMTMMPSKKKVDTTSPLRKSSNASCPVVLTMNTLPQKTKATKKVKGNSSPKSLKRKSPTTKCDEESPLQGELEAASLLANMFAV